MSAPLMPCRCSPGESDGKPLPCPRFQFDSAAEHMGDLLLAEQQAHEQTRQALAEATRERDEARGIIERVEEELLARNVPAECSPQVWLRVGWLANERRKSDEARERAEAKLAPLRAVRAAVEPTRRLTELLLASEHAHHATETERALVDACARADSLTAPKAWSHAAPPEAFTREHALEPDMLGLPEGPRHG